MNNTKEQTSNSIYERRVKEIMQTDVVSVHPHDSLHEAIDLIVENRVSALPVTDRRGRCIGIISVTDIMGLTHDVDDDLSDWTDHGGVSRYSLITKLRESFKGQRVDELMTDAPMVVGPEMRMAAVLREMLRHRVHRMPVVNGAQQLIGIISTMDVLSAFAEAAPQP